MSGLAAIQSRITDIEARLGIATRTAPVDLIGSTGATGAASADASSGTSLSGTRFAAALSAAGWARSGAPAGSDVVTAATRYLGVPYRWGGTDPATGLDCSGLVQRVFADLGIEVPRVVADQAGAGTPVPSLGQARPGDLLVWRGSPNHIGIYVGEGRMLHAPKTGDVVRIGDIRSAPPDTIRRITGGSPAEPVGAGAHAVPYGSLFAATEQRYTLPAGVLSAMAAQESGFDADAISPAGAIGLMQFMPGTADDLGINPRDPVQAVDGAGRYLRRQLDDFGSLPLALAAYNAGPGAVRAAGGIPAYDETTAYVASILSKLPGGIR